MAKHNTLLSEGVQTVEQLLGHVLFWLSLLCGRTGSHPQSHNCQYKKLLHRLSDIHLF
jgi:hypothetical protein